MDQRDKQAGREIDRQIETDRWTDTQVRLVGRQTNRQAEGQTDRHSVRETGRETDRRRHQQTDIPSERQTG